MVNAVQSMPGIQHMAADEVVAEPMAIPLAHLMNYCHNNETLVRMNFILMNTAFCAAFCVLAYVDCIRTTQPDASLTWISEQMLGSFRSAAQAAGAYAAVATVEEGLLLPARGPSGCSTPCRTP